MGRDNVQDEIRALERKGAERATDQAMVPASYAEKAMSSLLRLHEDLVEEKEKRIDLYRRLMEREQSLAELRAYVKLLESELARRGLDPNAFAIDPLAAPLHAAAARGAPGATAAPASAQAPGAPPAATQTQPPVGAPSTAAARSQPPASAPPPPPAAQAAPARGGPAAEPAPRPHEDGPVLAWVPSRG